MQKLRDRVKGLHKQRREITSLRKAAASIDPDRILQRVAEKYQVDRERLVARGERGLHARNVAMWMIWETGNKSLREIGELFGGLDYAAVAQRIRRTRSSHDSIAARKLKAAMLNVLDLTPSQCLLSNEPMLGQTPLKPFKQNSSRYRVE